MANTATSDVARRPQIASLELPRSLSYFTLDTMTPHQSPGPAPHDHGSGAAIFGPPYVKEGAKASRTSNKKRSDLLNRQRVRRRADAPREVQWRAGQKELVDPVDIAVVGQILQIPKLTDGETEQSNQHAM